MNPKLTAPSLLLSLALAACGGGGSDSAAPAPGNPSSNPPASGSQTPGSQTPSDGLLKGRLLGVQGVQYQAGEHKGVTDQTGQFQYPAGAQVQFQVGDILLGRTAGKAELTLADLAAGDADTEDNLIRFLLTLDYDLMPMNGALVTQAMHKAAKGKQLEFRQNSAQFQLDAEQVLQAGLASDMHVAAFRHSSKNMLPALNADQSEQRVRALRQARYPKVSAEEIAQLPGIEDEARQVIQLLLQDTPRPGHSPLENIFSATHTPLVLDGDNGSLVDLYVRYKQRLQPIGPDAPYVEREDLTPRISARSDLVDVQHFVVMTDFQLHDTQSPLHVNPLKFLIAASYYPASPSIPLHIDDMVRTLRVHEEQTGEPLEMMLFTGDFIDISQHNELRRGIDVLDGGLVEHDSGAKDDPIPGLADNGRPNDSFDAFTALGLNGYDGKADIPWYFVAGNHDGLMLGNFPITDQPLRLFGQTLRGGTREFFNSISTGRTNWLGYSPTLTGFLQHLFDPGSFIVAPDADRRVVTPFDVASEMFNSNSLPLGHGMQLVQEQQGTLENRLNYSFTSHNGLLRHIALDTSMPIGPEGWLFPQDIQWLKRELQEAKDAGQLVIVSSHHMPKDIVLNGQGLVKVLNSYPNVIAHIVAHDHANTIEPRPGRDAEHGYWEIQTSSMVNWPQQVRLMDIKIDRASGTGFIQTTMLNHEASDPYQVSQRGRFLSYLERYLEGALHAEDALVEAEGKPDARNTRLYFKVPAGVMARL